MMIIIIRYLNNSTEDHTHHGRHIIRMSTYVKMTTYDYKSSNELIVWHNDSHYLVKTLPRLDSSFRNSFRRYFYPALSVQDQLMAREVMKTFVSAMEKANVTYFMFYGTLLGACRHGGMIPWDDDLDMAFMSCDTQKMESALLDLEPKYGLIEYVGRWKFFPREFGSPVRKPGWRFPYVDIFSFDNSSSHAWEVCSPNQKIPLSDIFPLVELSFWNLNLPAPRRALSALGHLEYRDISQCRSSGFNHRLEGLYKTSPKTIRCKNLDDIYDIQSLCKID